MTEIIFLSRAVSNNFAMKTPIESDQAVDADSLTPSILDVLNTNDYDILNDNDMYSALNTLFPDDSLANTSDVAVDTSDLVIISPKYVSVGVDTSELANFSSQYISVGVDTSDLNDHCASDKAIFPLSPPVTPFENKERSEDIFVGDNSPPKKKPRTVPDVTMPENHARAESDRGNTPVNIGRQSAPRIGRSPRGKGEYALRQLKRSNTPAKNSSSQVWVRNSNGDQEGDSRILRPRPTRHYSVHDMENGYSCSQELKNEIVPDEKAEKEPKQDEKTEQKATNGNRGKKRRVSLVTERSSGTPDDVGDSPESNNGAQAMKTAAAKMPGSNNDAQGGEGSEKSKKKYVCDSCPKSFPSLSKYTIHYDYVHRGIRFRCDVCRDDFAQMQNVRRHFHRKHPQKIDEVKEWITPFTTK